MKPNDAVPRTSTQFKATVASLSVALSVAFTGSSHLLAAPFASPAITSVAQNVDYISTEAGYSLDLGFTVLVPSWVPGPFGGSPSIDAGGGYYGLYWMKGGGDPTFLHVTGQVGGGLPAGSPYDLNNELFINASVMGYDAIHDVTPAYDAVWWIAGGVLYKVESRNSSTDSLSLANSLISFEAPYSEPEPTEPPYVEPTEPPYVEPTPEPVDEQPVFEEPIEEEPTFEEPEADTPAVDTPSDEPSTSDEPVSAPESNDGDGTASATGGDSSLTQSDATTDGTGQASVNSDGTGGPVVPTIGGDGTGGTTDLNIPRRSQNGTETP